VINLEYKYIELGGSILAIGTTILVVGLILSEWFFSAYYLMCVGMIGMLIGVIIIVFSDEIKNLLKR